MKVSCYDSIAALDDNDAMEKHTAVASSHEVPTAVAATQVTLDVG